MERCAVESAKYEFRIKANQNPVNRKRKNDIPHDVQMFWAWATDNKAKITAMTVNDFILNR